MENEDEAAKMAGTFTRIFHRIDSFVDGCERSPWLRPTSREMVQVLRILELR